MTIREYINARISQWGIPVKEELIQIAFSTTKVEPTFDLTTKSEKEAYKVLYKLIPDILLSVPKSISEGGYSVSHDKDAMVRFYSMIANTLGLPDNISGKPKVKDITNKW